MELEEFGKERNRSEQWVLWRSREARPHGSGILYLHLVSGIQNLGSGI